MLNKTYIFISIFFLTILTQTNSFSDPLKDHQTSSSWRDTVVAPIAPYPKILAGEYMSIMDNINRLNKTIKEEYKYGGKNKYIIIKNLENVKKTILNNSLNKKAKIDYNLEPTESFPPGGW